MTFRIIPPPRRRAPTSVGHRDAARPRGHFVDAHFQDAAPTPLRSARRPAGAERASSQIAAGLSKSWPLRGGSLGCACTPNRRSRFGRSGSGSSVAPPCAGVDDERALYWGDRKPAGHGSTGSQFCRGCGKQFEGAITAHSNLLPRRYPGKPAGRLCPRCDQLQRGEVLAASDGVRDADPLEFAKAVAPVFASADSTRTSRSLRTVRTGYAYQVLAPCLLCVPEAQGSLARGRHYTVRTPCAHQPRASCRTYVPRTVAPFVGLWFYGALGLWFYGALG